MESSADLLRVFQEDQSDRTLFRENQMDWSELESRDRTREACVKAALHEGRLKTGADYYHAAMILQHGVQPEDFLLAHELCIIAIIRGEERAKWLAAASEDRFLKSIGRAQRFGTQHANDGPGAPLRLYPVDPLVTDEMRTALNVPTLAQAEERVRRRNAGFDDRSEAVPSR